MFRPLFFFIPFLVLVRAALSGEVPVSKAPPPEADVIRFVVMPDRTGGMRDGVFRDALQKANLLHPEFLLSIGDLIDGYTLDLRLLDEQWKEFDAMVDALDIPFYYVPGNHDISNPWMEEQWRKRLGDPYYYFEYKGALFLALHTEDGGSSGISPKQGAYFAKVLADHPDARWTFLFMHRPLWSYENQEGFEVIEAALQGRHYTLLSGHHHSYYYEPDEAGNERLILATAGGGSQMRGEEFGEFDHVTHVVLTDNGPKITHLRLDGFVDKKIVNSENRSRVETLRKGAFVQVVPSVADRRSVSKLAGLVRIENPDLDVLTARLRFPELDGVRFESEALEVSLAGGESREVPFSMESSSGGELNLEGLPQLFVEIEGIYGMGTEAELRLPNRKLWRVDWNRRMIRDGAARIDWETLDPPGYLTEGWDWHGQDDCLINFALTYTDRSVVARVEVKDDVVLFQEGNLSDRLSLFFDGGNGPRSFDFVPSKDGVLQVPPDFSGEATLTRTGDSLLFQIEFPFKAFGLDAASESLRFNLCYLDHDRLENQKPSRLYWKPLWGSKADYENSGLFFIPPL